MIFHLSLASGADFVKNEHMELVKHHPDSHCQAVFSAMLVALVVMLDAMAANPALHALVHNDANQSGHQCVVTLFAHGQVDAATPTVDVPALAVQIQNSAAFQISVFAPAIENLPAGRGPPTSPLPS
jgi:hypothetical protein